MKKFIVGVFLMMVFVLALGLSWAKLLKRGYTQEKYGLYTTNVVANIANLPFNEISLDDDTLYFVDVDFDEEIEKLSRNNNGDVFVYKKDKNGDYNQNVSLEIPYCWIKFRPCCPAHKAFTTINYLTKTIFTESHYGCYYSEKKKYKKVDDSWKETLPIVPLSILNKSLFPTIHLYSEWIWRDVYVWRWNYKSWNIR